jgi:hypothetical protein
LVITKRAVRKRGKILQMRLLGEIIQEVRMEEIVIRREVAGKGHGE